MLWKTHLYCESMLPPSPVCRMLGPLTRESSSIQLYLHSLQKSILPLGSTRVPDPHKNSPLTGGNLHQDQGVTGGVSGRLKGRRKGGDTEGMQKVAQANAKQGCLNIPLTFSLVCTQSLVRIVGTRCFMSQHVDDRKQTTYHKRREHLAINREQIQSALEERSSHHPAGHTYSQA